MRFVAIRELRLNPKKVWRALKKERELILTSNGRPFALITEIHEETLEEELAAVRRARMQLGLRKMQYAASQAGLDRLASSEIDHIISEVRRNRKKK